MNVVDQRQMPIKEFMTAGLLQEANRLFFHPRGLALAIAVDDDGVATLTGIWDARNDPGGIVFDAVDADKTVVADQLLQRHLPTRRAILGNDDGIQVP